MTTLQFTNEKGNARPAVRTAIKNQVHDYLMKATDGKLQVGPNGLYMQVATDEATGDVIYAVLPVSITTHDPSVEKPKAPSKKAKANEPIPNLMD